MLHITRRPVALPATDHVTNTDAGMATLSELPYTIEPAPTKIDMTTLQTLVAVSDLLAACARCLCRHPCEYGPGGYVASPHTAQSASLCATRDTNASDPTTRRTNRGLDIGNRSLYTDAIANTGMSKESLITINDVANVLLNKSCHQVISWFDLFLDVGLCFTSQWCCSRAGCCGRPGLNQYKHDVWSNAFLENMINAQLSTVNESLQEENIGAALQCVQILVSRSN
jgi:hypothetical protein